MDKIRYNSRKIFLSLLIGIIILCIVIMPIFICSSCSNLNSKNIIADDKLDSDSLNKEDKNFQKPKQGKISEFSTHFFGSSENRVHNITLASKALDGITIKPLEELSFNKVVGKRSYERGYKDAKVILNGVYVKGVGGGVCQVSTTLYNAWLLAGLDVVSVKNHTIPAHYVELSRDATVSDYLDLVLLNNSEYAVTLKTQVKDNTLTIEVYGVAGDYVYKLRSEILEEIPTFDAPPVYVDVDSVNQVKEEYYKGKNGYRSRLMIEKIKDGSVIEERELRLDYYPPKPNQKVIYRLRMD